MKPIRCARSRPLQSSLAAGLLAAAVPCQSRVVAWGVVGLDTAVHEAPTIAVGAGLRMTGRILADGRLFVHGWNGTLCSEVPPLPAGVRYRQVEFSHVSARALRSDGEIVFWGTELQGDPTTPALPPGVRYVKLAFRQETAAALRSDGQIVSWAGDSTLTPGPAPALASGLSYQDVSAGFANVVGLVSDGSIRCWGLNDVGQCNPPAFTPGVSVVQVSSGISHHLALLSDGSIVAWGFNGAGQTNVPPLPAGTIYTAVAAGWWHSLALRSDGALVGWGDNVLGCSAGLPPPAPGEPFYLAVAGGNGHTVVVLSDGTVRVQGLEDYGNGDPPRLLPGARFQSASAGLYHWLALREDGTIERWGDLRYGGTIPPLPSGTVYTKVNSGNFFDVALRSDGQVFAWGDNSFGQLVVPSLPPGVRYVDVVTGAYHAVARRSDGVAVSWGIAALGGVPLPITPPLPGVRHVDIAATYGQSAVLRSDDEVDVYGFYATFYPPRKPPLPPHVHWRQIGISDCTIIGLRTDGQVITWGCDTVVPTLPAGVYYVEVAAGEQTLAARRSDGQVEAWNYPLPYIPITNRVPPLLPGTSYQGVYANKHQETLMATVGPTSTFVAVGTGCAGTMRAARVVPMDTPRIGRSFEVIVHDLPVDAAIVCMGFDDQSWGTTPLPMSLTPLGMPGCSLRMRIERATFVAGSDRTARWSVAIPRVEALVGVQFFTQALVFDPQANGFGAVVSEASRAVIGR